MIPSARPVFGESDRIWIGRRVQRILKSGRLILGKYTEEFEQKFARYIGTRYSVAFSSCTSALEVVMRFLQVQGGEVVVPTNTFIACPNSVIFAGGKPVFADIDPKTYALSYETLRAKISPKTRAIMLVHLAGLPVLDTEEIREVCDKKGIALIEDCSHAHGATLNARKVGSFGDAGCFSFMATKVMTSGLGGMITTNNGALAEFAREVRNSAAGRTARIERIASDWMITETAAVMGLNQLRNLDRFLRRRNAIAREYMGGLEDSDGWEFFVPPANVTCSYYKFLVGMKRGNKQILMQRARKQGIELGTLYETPCNLQPLYLTMGNGAGQCPVAEEVLKHQVALPVHFSLTDNAVGTVLEFMKKNTR